CRCSVARGRRRRNSDAVPRQPPPSVSAATAAQLRARVRELDEGHRRRGSLMLHGLPSWLALWLRALLPPSLGGPSRLPRRPLPPIPIPGAGECVVTFIGHATALIRYAHARVLTDPCFARSLYSLRRLRPPGLPDGALESLDVVLLSHAHADHLNRASL